MCLDRAYDADTIRELLADHSFTAHIRTRGEEIELKQRKPDWRARRWVVEACHSWLNRNRAILIRWSKKDRIAAWTAFAPALPCPLVDSDSASCRAAMARLVAKPPDRTGA